MNHVNSQSQFRVDYMPRAAAGRLTSAKLIPLVRLDQFSALQILKHYREKYPIYYRNREIPKCLQHDAVTMATAKDRYENEIFWQEHPAAMAKDE
jgi:hypothetical protein